MGCGASVKKRYSGSSDLVTPLEWQPNRRASGSAHILIRNTGAITDSYDLEKDPLSKGTFSKVRLATHRDTFQRRAVKCLPKPRKQVRNQVQGHHATSAADFENEVKIIGRLDHPNIVRAFETFEDSMNRYLVMEFCAGGAVLEVLATLEEFNERQAAVVMQQVLRGLAYMHKLHIAHRDIRPSNLLLAKTTMVKDSLIKICDLGSACFLDDEKRMREVTGMQYYRAPEMDGQHLCTENVDAWSCGVVTFTLLCGYPTLRCGSTKEQLLQAAKGVFTWTRRDYSVCSKAVQSLLDQLLETDPGARLSVEKAQRHMWVRRQGGISATEPLELGRIKTLREHSQVANLKKRAKQVLAQRLDVEQIGELRDALRHRNDENDGIITHEELAKELKGLGRVHEDVNDLITDLATNPSQPIDYTDFMAAILQQREHNTECLCAEAFQGIDKEHTGTIAKRDVKQILLHLADRMQISQAEIDGVLKDSRRDEDHERRIDFEELLAMIRSFR